MSTLKWDIERQASSCSDAEFPETAEFLLIFEITVSFCVRTAKFGGPTQVLSQCSQPSYKGMKD